jgi:hypothetical protein
LYIGHQDKKTAVGGGGGSEKQPASHLFTYDLGQFVLSKDASYSLEHLCLLMQIMDTNVSHLDHVGVYEWSYLNSVLSNSKPIEAIERNFAELCEQVKSRIVAVYTPRNPHTCGVRSSGRIMTYADIATTCKSQQQSTLDTVLARIGGVQQVLVLVAKMVESENEEFYNKK